MPASAGHDLRSGRNPGIDVIRGLSIILVVIHHTALRIPLMKTGLSAIVPAPLLAGLSWDGYEAVFVFFVVSGFLIAGNSIRRWGRLSQIRPGLFYVMRAARILPCLLILVAALSLLHLFGISDYTITGDGQSLAGAIVSALGLHLNWYEGRTGYLPGGWDVLWSLSIEEVFYLAFPLVCLVLGRTKLGLAAFFAVLALSLPASLNALSHASEIWREKAYLPGMAAIAMGVGAALLVEAVPKPSRIIAAAAGWLGVAALASLFWWESAFNRLLGNGLMLVLTGSVALLMIAFHSGWGSRSAARGTSWLRSYGVLSYEIYLTHMFVVFSIVGLFRMSGSDLRFGWVWFVPSLLLSWGLGVVVDRVVSSRADRWIRAQFTAGSGILTEEVAS